MVKRSLGINAILNTIKTTLSIIFPLITFPYVSRVLQVEAIGLYNFSNSIVSYFLLLAGLGVATYAVREGTQYRENKREISNFVSEVYSINMLSTVGSYIFLLATVIAVSKLHNYAIAIAILSVEIFFTTFGVSWVCNIFEDFLFIAVQSIAVQTISLILTLLLIKNPSDIYRYIAIVAFSKAASFTINHFYVQKKYCRFHLKLKFDLRRHLKPILVIFSTSVAMTIYVSSDTTMLGFMTNDFQVGLYSTAVKIYTIVKNILAAILVVLVPRFSILLQNKEATEANRLFSKVFNTLIVLVFPAVVGLLITSEDVIHLIGGETYLGGTLSLQLLCVAIAFSLIATLYTSCILIPQKKEKEVLYATTVSAIANVCLNFIFIPLLGISGAALTTVIAEAIVCALSFVYSKEDIHLRRVGNNFTSVCIGCILIALIGILLKKMISVYYLRLFITVGLSVIAYLSTLIMFKNPVIFDIFNSVAINKMNK